MYVQASNYDFMNYQSPQFTLELQILLEAVKLCLLNSPKDKLATLINSKDVNWQKLSEMVIYHRIRPLFYEACRLVEFKNKEVKVFENFSRRQAIKNLVISEELGRVLLLFQENGIEVIPYKGILFIEKLYKNKILRESSDIDILVKPHNALRAIKLLIQEGYAISTTHAEITSVDDSVLTELIGRTQIQELSLLKDLPSGINVHIDFHWAVGETFHQYSIEVDELFEEANIETFQRRQLLIPNTKTIFKMMLNHHGGRGCWIRLKDFSDMLAFRSQHPEVEVATLQTWAAEMKMSRVFAVGNAIVEGIFLGSEQQQSFEPKLQKHIFDYWETSKEYDYFWSKYNHRNIYRQLQDKPMSWLALSHQLIKYYAIPNEMEKKRLVVFPDRFVYLNAFTKLVSYAWFRGK